MRRRSAHLARMMPNKILAPAMLAARQILKLRTPVRRTAMDVLGRVDRFVDAIRHYQLRQIDLHRFELFIVPAVRFSEVGAEGITHAIGSALEGTTVGLRLVEAVPRDPSGKRRAFVSEIARNHHA